MIGGIFRLFGLLLLSVLLASCGGGGGGDDGGFTGEKINVTISVDRPSVPVNLSGQSPNPALPYTSTITAKVTRSGSPLTADITIARTAGDAAQGSLFKLDDPTQGFQQIVVAGAAGTGQAYFHANTSPGVVTITASATDPGTKQVVSASVNITVVGEERPATTLSFTGPYVNAVVAGQQQFGEAQLQNGAYTRSVSVVVSDANGNPTNPNTQINFFLVDAPITGYPANPGSFFVAGNNGDPVEGQYQFTAAGGDFINKTVRPADRLILDGRATPQNPTPDNRFLTGVRTIDSVVNPTTLNIRQGNPFAAGPNNGPTVPYIIGHAENAALLSPSFTDLNGVANTLLTYPASRIGQTAVLVACTVDYSACGILNTCDASGGNCKSVFLDVTNGSDRKLTVSTNTLGPNRTTNVQMCLRDSKFAPLPATEIRYNIGSAGPATVTVNGITGNKGGFFTGSDGCALVPIASSGQIPGSQPILLNFTSDFVAAPATITINAPGAGQMDGLFSCEFAPDKGTGVCTGTLRLTDSEGSPIPDVGITLGSVTAPGPFKVTYVPVDTTNPAFGLTNANGEVQVTVTMDAAGEYVFPFQTEAFGTAKYTLNVTVPRPGQLVVTLLGSTTATLAQPYSALLQAVGGILPYSWSIIGSLPPGLTLNATTGAITGTPTTAGSYSFVAQVTDKIKNTGFAAFTIAVDAGTPTEPLVVELVGPTTGTVNVLYNALLSATGGTAPYTFALLVKPDWLSVAPATGALSGKPPTAGVFVIAAKVTDSKGATGTGNFTITIAEGTGLTVELNGPTTAPQNVLYNGLFSAAGGTAPYTFKLIAGSLPTGMENALKADGTLSGTPTVAGTFPFTVQATDSKQATGTGTFTLTVTGGGGGGNVGSIVLLANPPQLASAGLVPIDLTAVVRDTNNVLLKDITVTFSADYNGTIQVVRAVTDETGTATAILTSPGDKSNRNNPGITVVARAGNPEKTGTVIVPVVGTTISSSGANSAVIGGKVKITFTLKDSAGVGISGQTLTVTADPVGNVVSPPNPVTNTAGQAVVEVTANLSGKIVANWVIPKAGTTPEYIGAGPYEHLLSVATDNFVFTVPDPSKPSVDVCLNASQAELDSNCTLPRVKPPQTLTVKLTTGNPPVGVAGKTVAFETTRGTLLTTSDVTNAAGEATTSISSDNAGPAVITAKTTDTSNQPIQAQVQVNFVATLPTQMTLQAAPSTISVNLPPSTDQQSTITSTVRDVNFNLVKGVTVNFTLTDVTGGTISPASAVTDAFGQASTVYTAGSSPSALNGVRVDAAVVGFPVIGAVTLTVAQKALFITLGTGNTITEPNSTTFALPYSLLVTDTAGLPIQNAVINLGLVPVPTSTGLPAYFKGRYTKIFGVTGAFLRWELGPITASCLNEDLNQNGILDPGEDFNGNGRLDPGNRATVSQTTLTTGANGFAFFDVNYAQEYSNWIQVQLTARATVAGSEATETAQFILPIAANKLIVEADPPGNPSPYGVAATCADPN